ncbi:DUF4349 domain-containing protein [Nocardioides sp. SOB77]|uniref:DUF4349 domain-containing protein n=1 Tax=Nocardioides oceani TaxID=3058369 RepID=A0ABT8F9V3_9ACTN|nr:DUF4349 domain-containing protein [Nocardioides oceani]MDN4171448.1 DUF4349 domain-containing protein [Nocardioides oceani]
MTPHPRAGRRAAAALAAVTAIAALAACSGGPGGSSDSGGSSAEAPAAGGRAASAESATDGLAAFAEEDSAAAPVADTATTRKVISTGNVALRADDVGEARFEVQKVVDRYGGEVAEEQTATDDEGEVKRSRLVLRVPSARFDEAVESLKGAAELITAGTTSEDVTPKVLDVDVRVRVQRRSIRRIELLLDRAQSIRDIVSIEAQLSRRQATLASLEKQQDYLADQTAMSTISVSLERTPDEPTAPKDDDSDDAGFLTGLSTGWDGLVATAVAAATVVGALLPFAAVALLLGLPAWLLVKRMRRRPAALD